MGSGFRSSHRSSPGPLSAESQDGSDLDVPPEGGVEFKSIPGAPKPAETPEQRLRQMRLLTQDFAAEDYFQNQSWQRLRLLAKPLARVRKNWVRTRSTAPFSASFSAPIPRSI